MVIFTVYNLYDIKPEHNREMDKRLHPPLPQER